MSTVHVRYVDGVEDGIDFDAHYIIPGHSGVAWSLCGWAQTWEPTMVLVTVDEDGEYDPDGTEVEVPSDDGDGEWVDNRDQVVAVLVGDDRRQEFDRTEPVVLAESEFCHDCGSTGCQWGRP